jgi:hypothetical protein
MYIQTQIHHTQVKFMEMLSTLVSFNNDLIRLEQQSVSYTYIYTYIHIMYIHTYIHVYIHITYTQTQIHTYTGQIHGNVKHPCLFQQRSRAPRAAVCMARNEACQVRCAATTHAGMLICMYVSMSTCMYVCMYVCTTCMYG